VITPDKVLEAFLSAAFVLTVVGFLLAVVSLTLSKLFKFNAHPLILSLVTVSIFFLAVEAFSAPMICISDEPKIYKFDVESLPYFQLDEWESGPKKGLKTLFVLGKTQSTLQYRCEGCAVKYKRTYNLNCKQGVI